MASRSNPEQGSARFQDIPVPRRDVVAALLQRFSTGDQALEAQEMRALCELLRALYHLEFHDELEVMKRSYAPFNPDLDDERFDVASVPTPERAAVLAARLRSVLERGNYEVLGDADVAHAFAERSLFPLAVVVDTSVYEEVVIYARGETLRSAEIPRWYGLDRRTIEVPTFDRVCLYIRFKTHEALGIERSAASRFSRRKQMKFEPGTTILKLFRNIPKADLEILFPNCVLEMRPSDKLFFGVPALVGGIPVIAKLIPAVFALAIMLGFRHGEIDSASIITGLTGLVVLGAYLFRQWSKFKNRHVLFNKELSENLYFRNLDNNMGVLTRLVDEAEEEECKEAMLAYFFLLDVPEGLTAHALDEAVEAWLRERFEVEIDFEISDALAKLEDLGLVRRAEDHFCAHSLNEALDRSRLRWDAALPTGNDRSDSSGIGWPDATLRE